MSKSWYFEACLRIVFSSDRILDGNKLEIRILGGDKLDEKRSSNNEDEQQDLVGNMKRIPQKSWYKSLLNPETAPNIIL